MSNQASLELCKELYELSGWKNTFASWNLNTGQIVTNKQGLNCTPEFYISAYDLGYLLRKLPERILYYNFELLHCKNWKAAYIHLQGINVKYIKSADTPEDAVVRLALELFKEGVLK